MFLSPSRQLRRTRLACRELLAALLAQIRRAWTLHARLLREHAGYAAAITALAAVVAGHDHPADLLAYLVTAALGLFAANRGPQRNPGAGLSPWSPDSDY